MSADDVSDWTHTPGKLVPVVKRESVLAEFKNSSRGRRINIRWIYDTHVTLACGCVIVYPRRDAPTRKRSRCYG